MLSSTQLNLINDNLERARNLDAPANAYHEFLLQGVGLNADQANTLIGLIDSDEKIDAIMYRQNKDIYEFVGADILGNELSSSALPVSMDNDDDLSVDLNGEASQLELGIPDQGVIEEAEFSEITSNEENLDINPETIDAIEPSVESDIQTMGLVVKDFEGINESTIEHEEPIVEAEEAEEAGAEKVFSLGFEGVELENSLNTEQVLEIAAKSGGSHTTKSSNAGGDGIITYIASEFCSGKILRSTDGKELLMSVDSALAVSRDGKVYLTNKNPSHDFRPAKKSGLDDSLDAVDEIDSAATLAPKVGDKSKDETEEEKAKRERGEATQKGSSLINLNIDNLFRKKGGAKNDDLKALKYSTAALSSSVLKDMTAADRMLKDILNPKFGGPLDPKNQDKLRKFHDVMGRLGDSFDVIKKSNITSEDLPDYKKIRTLTEKLGDKLNSEDGKKILFSGMKALDTKVFQSIKEGISQMFSKLAEKVTGASHAPG
jgi:hypothetical protein